MNDIFLLHALDSAIIEQLRKLIGSTGWTERQVNGQLAAIKQLIIDAENGVVAVIERQGAIIGFISAQFYSWNRLGQIHGLIVAHLHRRQGLAAKLIAQIETSLQQKGARGLYVDTPTNNVDARKFYEAMGYRQDYVMTEYYDDNCDGVTYLKLFKWKVQTITQGKKNKEY